MKKETEVYEGADISLLNEINRREVNRLERELELFKRLAQTRELTPYEINRIMIIRECFEFDRTGSSE